MNSSSAEDFIFLTRFAWVLVGAWRDVPVFLVNFEIQQLFVILMHFYNTGFIFSPYFGVLGVPGNIQRMCAYTYMRYDCGYMNTRVIIIAAIGITGVHPQQSLPTAPQTHYLCSTPFLVCIKTPLKSATIFLADALCSRKCLKLALRCVSCTRKVWQ